MKKFIVDRFEGNKAVLECENGETAVFERKALPKNIKEGDVLEITLGAKSVKVRVTQVKEVVRKEDADTMYEAVV